MSRWVTENTDITILYRTTNAIDDSHTIDTSNNLLPLLTGISTPADTILLGEVIQDEDTGGVGDGVALSEPTQWEKFADSIVKTHLDKALRRGGGATSAAAAAASTLNGSGGKDEDNHVTEQNIEL